MILITLALGAILKSRCSAFTRVLLLPPPSETRVEGDCALLKVSLKCVSRSCSCLKQREVYRVQLGMMLNVRRS